MNGTRSMHMGDEKYTVLVVNMKARDNLGEL
jgi:hypothetical protein